MQIAVQPKTDRAQRVLFGPGLRASLKSEIGLLGRSRAMILSTPQQSDVALDIAALLPDKVAGVFSRAAMHTPVEITQEALVHCRDVGADCLIAVGGGSTTGLGKALALRTDLPQIVIPTTYAGSEATPILGQTEQGMKTTLTDLRVLPDVILYDPELVATLPVQMSVNSGLNAMAHAVEALYAKDRTAETTQLALEGLEAFATGLPKILTAPGDLNAREDTLRGAYACGAVLGRVGMALHHKLCHTLGGSFDLPHAETHAILLPHATHYNSKVAEEALRPITNIFGGRDAGDALWSFASQMGAPLALKEFGLSEADLDRAAELALSKPYWNPREVTREGIRALLQNAWSGVHPSH